MRLLFLFSLTYLVTEEDLISAEAGMPQLDPTYWASQGFWLILIFSILYLVISKFFIPRIKNNLEVRENKIKNDLDEAKNLKELAEKKEAEYMKLISEAKKEVTKNFIDAKKKLINDLNSKKESIENEINKELEKTQKDINELKKDSINSINIIAEGIASKIIQDISGDKLNESSIKAVVSDTSKRKVGEYL